MINSAYTKLKWACLICVLLIFGLCSVFYLTSTGVITSAFISRFILSVDSPVDSLVTDSPSSITFYPCVKTPDALDAYSTIQCGVYRDRVHLSDNTSHYFAIRFAVLTPYQLNPNSSNSNSSNLNSLNLSSNNVLPKDKRPLLYIEGGPGVGNVVTPESLLYWQHFLHDEKIQRPLIIYSPIGTQGSLPNPICRTYYNDLFNLLNSRSLNEITQFTEQVNSTLQSCFKQEKTIEMYSSYTQKKMVLNLMAALNFKEWHVWGSSYGTRLALLLGHDPAVKRLLLDAPYLFHQGVYSQDIRLYYNALRLLESKWLESKPVSVDRKQPQNKFSTVFNNALQTLSDNTIFIPVRHRRHKPSYLLKDIHYLLTPKRLFELGFFSLYSNKNTQHFFDLLIALSNERLRREELSSQELRGEELKGKELLNNKRTQIKNTLIDYYIDSYTDKSFNPITYYFVECQDNGLSSYQDVNNAIQQQQNSFLKDRLKGDIKRWQSILMPFKKVLLSDYAMHPCHDAPFNQRNTVNDELYPNKTMLFLTGEYDPITPSADLTLLPKQDKLFTLIKKEAGHGVLTGQHCQPGVIEQFLTQENITVQNIENIKALCK